MDHFGRIAESLRYIDGHLGESLRLEAVACRAYLSPHHFHRLFSAVVGQSLALSGRVAPPPSYCAAFGVLATRRPGAIAYCAYAPPAV